ERHQYYETVSSGSGAGDGFAGADVVQTHMTNSRLTDPEVLEWRYPVRLERYVIRRGSGGAGGGRGGGPRRPGGPGLRRATRGAPVRRADDGDHPDRPPAGGTVRDGRGLAGGAGPALDRAGGRDGHPDGRLRLGQGRPR